ncbi:bifunctional glutamate N-acetyltransferase/amino-acid acetyltransferase ArgJ [Lichenihabitans sp. Uapishka_5]|uniref:bifunctional glutamate N-acetyltransferase/amino-acid acetyltransferase ArgJ n=1 Tax=Lichenihabitans sp. Uapishka_5 TaxID=3037302 RepID=UPI0029E7D803|nr:bifunctional glutamate N-acetyltransferase/amino-acid acetyltransferase ArgJ [Lichenihabitans sp. Uapishka_5]MDX7951606.1 bifunctional glutamate N-acetyltransferase/amino-acid acetyltransferase ArgJ [Lichenihabitans sp. Uapishka_5]
MAPAVPVSPLAPTAMPAMPPVAGVRFASGAAGIKYKGRTDVTLVLFDEGTAVAGVFTTSKCPSAPVDWCRANLAAGRARALVVNSGNANAFTGRKGIEATALTAQLASQATGATQAEIFLASTGVIGEPLPAERFGGVLGDLARSAEADGVAEAARAIMTTDTYPKVATATTDLGGTPVTLNGIAKGAGMIAPDMATMLSFVFTDAPIAAPVLQALLSRSVKTSFNAITVDSDTSTSDTLMIFATGAAAARGAPTIDSVEDPRLTGFAQALDDLLLDLAHQVVKDGEGARKFIAVTVNGAETNAAAKRIALSIANSPLVKTAVGGEDANWGRIVMAVGKAGERAERDRLAIFFGDTRVALDGERDPAYSEATTSAYMRNDAIAIRVEIGLGDGKATVWTCDLTKAYVEINGDYRS